MSYTPGPWRMCYSEDVVEGHEDKFRGGNIRSDHHQDGTGALLLETGSMFHDYIPDREEELANLRLAAASPDLLAALQNLLGYIEATDDDIDHTEMCLNTGDAVLNAEAAIAKATGREED